MNCSLFLLKLLQTVFSPALFHDFRVETEQCSSRTKRMLFALIVLIAFIAAVSSSETIKATIFADNYFEFYVNGFTFIFIFLIAVVYCFPHLFTLTHYYCLLLSSLIHPHSSTPSIICYTHSLTPSALL